MTAIQGVARLGANPELKYIDVGEDKKPVCEMRVYLVNGRQDKTTEEWRDQGFWAQVNVWGKCAEPAAKMFTTGDKVIIDGNLVQVSWPDKDDSEKSITGMKIDTNSVSPYLPDLVSLTYKERKSQSASREAPAASNGPVQSSE